MYKSPLSTKANKEWIILGHNSSVSQDPTPTTRAVYSFQPRLRHMYFRKKANNKVTGFDQRFSVRSSVRENEIFSKFPVRKTPWSVKSKRPNTEFADFLGTQLIYVKKNNRLYFDYYVLD